MTFCGPGVLVIFGRYKKRFFATSKNSIFQKFIHRLQILSETGFFAGKTVKKKIVSNP